jgi:hypothetical protein
MFLNPRWFSLETELCTLVTEHVTADYSAQNKNQKSKKPKRILPRALHFNTHWDFIIGIPSQSLSLIYRFDASDSPH